MPILVPMFNWECVELFQLTKAFAELNNTNIFHLVISS